MTEGLRRPLPKPLLLFCWSTLAATALAWSIVGIATWQGLPYPYNWPLVRPGNSYFDLLDYYGRFAYLHTTKFFTTPGFPFTYCAPGALIYSAFYHIGQYTSVRAYFACVLVGFLVCFFFLRKNLIKYGLAFNQVTALLALTVLASYPFLFCLERGNLEAVLALGLAAGTWAYYNGRTFTAAILWGSLGSVKLYPLLLLALFLSRRQYRQLAVSVFSAAVVTLVALLYIGPTILLAQQGIHTGLGQFIELYALHFSPEIGFDHSLFGLIKLLASPWTLPSPEFLTAYMITLAVIMLSLYFLRIRKLPLTNQLLVLTISSIILPPTSFDYTLTQLYAPWAALMFVASSPASVNKTTPGISWAMVLLALLFTPTNFLFHEYRSEGAQLKCVLLIALLVIGLIKPFERTESYDALTLRAS